MSIKTFVDALDSIRKSEDGLEMARDAGFQIAMRELMEEASANCDLAESVLKERISENELVKFMLMLQKMTVSAAAASGGSALLLCDVAGELQSYTHTVILTVIGALIQEEIL